MRTLPNASTQLATIARLETLFREHDLAYWLFGGWAVDFHAGRVTRSHDDVDIAIWASDAARIGQLLEQHEWLRRPEPGEDGYTCYEHGAVRLEVAFLARDENGSVYTPLANGRGTWPPDTFGDDVLELEGVRANVIRRQALVADKSVHRADPNTAAKDRADVRSLSVQA